MPWTPPTTYTDDVSTWGAADVMALGQSLEAHTDAAVGAVQADVAVVKEAPLNVAYPEYGAVAGSSSDQSLAFQAGIDAIPAGGGEMYAFGDFVVNNGLVWREGVPIKLRGAGNGGAGNIFGTRLKRTTGAAEMISAVGTGTGLSNRVYVELEDMELSGGFSGVGTVLRVERASHLRMKNVRIARTAASGAVFKEIYDSTTYGVIIENCGTAETAPAAVFDAVTGVGDQGGSATFQWFGTIFQGNTGTDIKLTGSAVDGAPSNEVQFIGCKMEAGSGSYPFIDFDYAQNCAFTGLKISSPTARTGPMVRQNGTSNGSRANRIVGSILDCAASSSVLAYYVDHGQGSLDIIGSRLTGSAPTTGYVRIRSTVSAGRHFIKACPIPIGAVPRIVDERAAPERLDKTIVRWERRGGSATVGLVGTTPTIDFDQTTLEDSYNNVTVPPDAVPGGQARFRLLWAPAVATGGAVFWRVISQASFATGESISGAGTNYDVTTTAPGTIGQLVESTPTTGPAAEPGDVLQVYIQRNAANAGDTLAGDARLTTCEAVFDKVI